MKKPPIFIHSLFRTGSTYVWNRFRRAGSLRCFYEPFHPELKHIRVESPDPWRHEVGATIWMHHPRLEAPYLEEYFPLLRSGTPGVPHFRKSFSFDDFCRRGDSPHQARYLDSLIDLAGEKRAVLQFNRSALRTGWFRKQYPQALNLYLVRHPDHQFHSQQSLFQTLGLDTFQVMDLMAISINRDAPEFLPLSRVLPLPRYEHADFSVQRRFFSRTGSALSPHERYFLFYYLWFTCLVENLAVSADILSIDALSFDADYRNAVETRLSEFTEEKIDFSDAAVKQYEDPPLADAEGLVIRRAAQALVLARVDHDDVIKRILLLPDCVRNTLMLETNLPEPAPLTGEFTVPLLRPIQEIRDAFMDVLGGDMERKYQEGCLLRSILRSGDRYLPVSMPGALDHNSPDSQRERLNLETERIYELEAELREAERKARVQVDTWKIRVRDLEKKVADLAAALERARAEAADTAIRLDSVVRDLNQCRRNADLLHDQLQAVRSTRWYRWSKKMHFLGDAE